MATDTKLEFRGFTGSGESLLYELTGVSSKCSAATWLMRQAPAIAKDLRRFKGKIKNVQIKYKGMRIPFTINLNDVDFDQEPEATLYTAPVIEVWTPALSKAFVEASQNERPCGLVVLETQVQIWINSAAERMLGVSGREATKFNMSDFWHPEDLEALNHQIRDLGTVCDRGAPDPFEFIYRCRLGNGWARFSTLYRIVDDKYRFGSTVRAPEPISVPV